MGIRFSIITVCFNSAGVIGRAIDSLRQQSHPDWEWVVIDGGSSDGTQDLVRAAGLPLGHFASEPDRGIYDAMNKGVAAARGDVLYFLNSDDLLFDAHVLRDIAAVFASPRRPELVYGNVAYVDSAGFRLRRFAHVSPLNLPHMDLNHQALFATRALFGRVGGFDLRFRLNADYDWILRTFRAGARRQWVDRNVAFFSAGGAHTRHPELMGRERRAVRCQYVSSLRHDFGELACRALQKACVVLTGHRIGERLLDAPATYIR